MAEKIDSYTDLQRAFLCFAHHLLQGNEGMFFSNGTDNGDVFWSFGYGSAQKVPFDTNGTTLFSVFNYKGDRSFHYTFEQVFSSESKPLDESHINIEKIVSALESIPLIDIGNGIDDFLVKDQSAFEQNVHTIQKAQQRGDMWVCNLTHPLCGKVDNDTIVLASFWNFLLAKKSHVGGVVFTGDQKMCSMSPELFLYVENNILTTKPVKGTDIDKEALLESEKEIAELSMVTDLLRNDIGMIAKKVSVIDERQITSHNTFYHAHAHIEGILDDEGLTEKRIKNLLPAGSITGCPKKRVCEYIERLEGYDRGWYTGVFGVKISDGRAWYNILIRTLFVQDGVWTFPVGGGITHLSDPIDEWKETLLKTDSLQQFCFSKKEKKE